MRTHVRPALQCHPGRRRAATEERLVLRLQRTIGNRATTRLILRKPEVLTKAGIQTDDRVSGKTPQFIQSAVEESEELKPYLKDKFPKSSITTDFEIHTDEDEFNQAAKSYLHNKDLMTKAKRAEEYGHIGGFFDRSTRHIHVRSRTKFGHAVHEAMHKVAHPAFHGFYGTFINEGVTQYFADRLLVEHGLGIVTDHEYKDELACAKKLVDLVGDWKTVAAAYFQNDTKLRDAMLKKLNMDPAAFQRAMNADAGKVCARL
jgi:hypothetical protein